MLGSKLSIMVVGCYNLQEIGNEYAPFVQLTCENEVKQTTPNYNEGVNPTWN